MDGTNEPKDNVWMRLDLNLSPTICDLDEATLQTLMEKVLDEALGALGAWAVDDPEAPHTGEILDDGSPVAETRMP